MKRPLVIGLTGGIASGKSTVASHLRHLGALVIDADEEARKVVEPGSPGLQRVVEAFGPWVLLPDGNLDRKRLAEKIYSDSQQRIKLEKLLHPEILQKMKEQLNQAIKSKANSVIVLDIPLLFEVAGFLSLVDKVLVVYVPLAIQLKRLQQRDGLTEEKALERIMSQIPLEDKKASADYVIDNSGSIEQTNEKILSLWKEWMRICESL